MTRYIEWGDEREQLNGSSARIAGGSRSVDPTDLATVQALWSALPPDLRLALAKTAPRVAGRWTAYELGELLASLRLFNSGGESARVVCVAAGEWSSFVLHRHFGLFPTLTEAQSACDAALLAQGYVLDNG